MGTRDISRNGESKPRAARLQITAFVQPVKRAERFFAAGLGNARPVIVYLYFHVIRIPLQRYVHVLSMLESIVDQIGGAALESVSPHRKHDASLRRYLQAIAI